MSWHPNDLVTDTDLLAYESGILTNFNTATWQTKRQKALEDWLGPILRTNGFEIERLRTRNEADLVLGFTGAAYTDLTSATRDTTADDLDLAAVFATVGTDALYIGSKQNFRGLSIRMADTVSAVTAKVSVANWSDAWKSLTLTDGTISTSGKSFSGGGAISWTVPSTWVKRSINGSDPLYWVKVTISATPTAAKAGQIGVIRRSVLCAPAALRTLTLIMREAPTGGSGPWMDKAAYYETEADAALQRALLICGGEFETDEPPTDLISEEESEQTTAEAAGTGWRMERY
jgi:hypothetical protein